MSTTINTNSAPQNSGATATTPRKGPNKTQKILLGIIAALAVVAIVLFFVIHNNSKNNSQSIASVTPSASATATIKKTGFPLLDQNPKAPLPDSKAVTVTLNKGIATTNNGHKLTLTKSALTTNSDTCSVQKATDFCYVGHTTMNGMNLSVYYMKDATHSRMFENPTKFQTVTIKGSPSSGIVSLNIANQSNAAMVVTLKDSSGWLILSNSSDFKKVAAISPKVTLS